MGAHSKMKRMKTDEGWNWKVGRKAHSVPADKLADDFYEKTRAVDAMRCSSRCRDVDWRGS